jgi:small subunit ribosomal protein S20
MEKPAQGAAEKKRPKRPTERKRNSQNKKQRMINKSMLSSIRTKIRQFLTVKERSQEQQKALDEIYGLVDRASKKGIFKKNKSSRIKSRLARRFHSLAA